MLGFEQWIFVVGSDCSTNWATTTAQGKQTWTLNQPESLIESRFQVQLKTRVQLYPLGIGTDTWAILIIVIPTGLKLLFAMLSALGALLSDKMLKNSRNQIVATPNEVWRHDHLVPIKIRTRHILNELELKTCAKGKSAEYGNIHFPFCDSFFCNKKFSGTPKLKKLHFFASLALKWKTFSFYLKLSGCRDLMWSCGCQVRIPSVTQQVSPQSVC